MSDEQGYNIFTCHYKIDGKELRPNPTNKNVIILIVEFFSYIVK